MQLFQNKKVWMYEYFNADNMKISSKIIVGIMAANTGIILLPAMPQDMRMRYPMYDIHLTPKLVASSRLVWNHWLTNLNTKHLYEATDLKNCPWLMLFSINVAKLIHFGRLTNHRRWAKDTLSMLLLILKHKDLQNHPSTANQINYPWFKVQKMIAINSDIKEIIPLQL